MLEHLIHFESLGQVAGAFVEDLIIRQIQMREHLRRQQELCNLPCTWIADSVVRKIKLTYGFVESEPLNEYVHQVVIDLIAWHAQIHEWLRGLETFREDLRVAHLHAELGPLVLPAYVLRAVRNSQMRQVGQVLEDYAHVQIR